MKINIPYSLINQLLLESQSFRSHVINSLFDSVDIKSKIEELIFSADGKNDAIKKIREFCANRNEEIETIYPDLVWITYSDGKTYLTLGSAKRFVESVRSTWD